MGLGGIGQGEGHAVSEKGRSAVFHGVSPVRDPDRRFRALPVWRNMSLISLAYFWWYNCLVKVKTSITLPRELLAAIDRCEANRSDFMERAARAYLARLAKIRREGRDRQIIEQHAKRLNKEAADVLEYQRLP